MPKKRTIYRTTISIPYDLKKRMDAAGSDVNWSAVAAKAFEAVLGEIAARKAAKTMDDVIQRLRASKHEFRTEKYQQGHQAGTRWAKSTAEFEELNQLDKILRAHRYNFGVWLNLVNDNMNISPGTAFFDAVYPELKNKEEERTERLEGFWEDNLGPHIGLADDVTFVQGFADGAREIWSQVKDKLF